MYSLWILLVVCIAFTVYGVEKQVGAITFVGIVGFVVTGTAIISAAG